MTIRTETPDLAATPDFGAMEAAIGYLPCIVDARAHHYLPAAAARAKRMVAAGYPTRDCAAYYLHQAAAYPLSLVDHYHPDLPML